MTYKQLMAQARKLSDREITASVAGLAADPRFAAVLAVIDGIKSQAADEASDLKYAANPGHLAHAAGMRYGLRILEGKIGQALMPPRKTGAQRPEEDGG